MKNSEELRQQLRSINRKSYPAYKGLKGLYHFGNYILSIDHVQGDPFASPSHVSIQISHRDAGFPVEYYKDTLTGTTLCDYLTRQFEKQVSQYSFRAKGSGKSGLLTVSHCGQEVLSRTACEITEKGITARFLWASLLMAARSTPLNWKKSFLIFCLYAFKNPFSIPALMQRNYRII